MPELYIVKTGYERFDALHALGLSVFIATGIDAPVKLRNCGTLYSLTFPEVPRKHPLQILDKFLILPAKNSMDNLEKKNIPTEVLTLDGMLAALFTTPGPRVVSIQDMMEKRKFNSEVVKLSLEKAHKAVNRWRSFIEKASQQMDKVKFWNNLIANYASGVHAIPIPTNRNLHPINILMTIEPSLSYSMRQAFSDGNVAHQANMTVENLPYAPLFALLGATRFLRAQRVNNGFVNFYVPIPSKMVIDMKMCIPALPYSSFDPDVAFVMVNISLTRKGFSKRWSEIACQTLQTQQAKQSICIERSTVELEWINRFNNRVLKSWQHFLINARKMHIETDNLIDFLISRDPGKFIAHLSELSCSPIFSDRASPIRGYNFTDIKEITLMADIDHKLPLSTILLNKKGTIRFGHALRQLQAKQNGIVREIVDDLDVVNDLERLLAILSRAVEACVIQDAKYEFTIVPDDQDLYLLLEDVQKFGVKQVASILIILAALRYPKRINGVETKILELESKDTAKELLQ